MRKSSASRKTGGGAHTQLDADHMVEQEKTLKGGSATSRSNRSIRRERVRKAQQEREAQRKRARRRWPHLSALELPEDVLSGQARVMLLGKSRAVVENHRGIVELTEERVRINTADGLLCFEGTGLTLSQLRADALHIEGEIRMVTLPG